LFSTVNSFNQKQFNTLWKISNLNFNSSIMLSEIWVDLWLPRRLHHCRRQLRPHRLLSALYRLPRRARIPFPPFLKSLIWRTISFGVNRLNMLSKRISYIIFSSILRVLPNSTLLKMQITYLDQILLALLQSTTSRN